MAYFGYLNFVLTCSTIVCGPLEMIYAFVCWSLSARSLRLSIKIFFLVEIILWTVKLWFFKVDYSKIDAPKCIIMSFRNLEFNRKLFNVLIVEWRGHFSLSFLIDTAAIYHVCFHSVFDYDNLFQVIIQHWNIINLLAGCK